MSTIICELCGFETSSKGIVSHLRHKHPECSTKRYYDEFLKLENENICPVCGKETKFLSISSGYNKHCSRQCSMKDPQTTKKRETTNLERFGVKNTYQSEVVKGKIKQVWLDKYGVDNPNKTLEVRDKIKFTNQIRYSGNAPMCSEIIQEKSKTTCKKHFGVEHPTQNKDILEKSLESRQSLIESIEKKHDCTHFSKLCKRFGFGWAESPLRELCFKEHGFLFLSKDLIKEIELYAKCDGSYTEYFVYKQLKTLNIEFEHHNRKLIKPYELDFYLPTYKIAIECNGYFHKEDSFINRNQNAYHKLKQDLCDKLGIKLIFLDESEVIYNESQKIQ